MDSSSPEAQAILRYYSITYDEVIFYKFHHQIGKYLLLAGTTVMIWDHITTLSDEIRYVWQVKGRWTIAMALFGLNRYVTPVGFIVHLIHFLLQSPERPMCGVGDLTAYWNIVSFACVQIVLMLRVWVMYGKSNKIGIFLGTVFTVALVASLIVPLKQPRIDIGLVASFPIVLTFCGRSLSSAYFWLFIIASSVEAITFCLFCVKVYLARKESMTTPILSALFTQGAAYYAVILCAFAISIPATFHKEMYIPLTDPNTVILISCIACNRLILSLRGLYYSRTVVGPTTLSTLTRGEYRHTIQMFVSNTSSNGVATSLGTSTLAAYDKVEDDWIRGRAEDSGIDLEFKTWPTSGETREDTEPRFKYNVYLVLVVFYAGTFGIRNSEYNLYKYQVDGRATFVLTRYCYSSEPSSQRAQPSPNV